MEELNGNAGNRKVITGGASDRSVITIIRGRSQGRC